jgi:hypothetical protein
MVGTIPLPYVKPLPTEKDCPSGLVTTTVLAPFDPEGVTQVIDVEELNVVVVQDAPPIVTCAPSMNCDPVIFTEVPPEICP